ncbi:hypothetical protein P3T16_004538 [Paraburkholderia sp. GAS42]|jgi:hypothetical protein
MGHDRLNLGHYDATTAPPLSHNMQTVAALEI